MQIRFPSGSAMGDAFLQRKDWCDFIATHALAPQ
jgi:hypothetical protein